MAEDPDMESLSVMCIHDFSVLSQSLTSNFKEWKELEVFRELLRMVPGLEAHLMDSSEDEVIHIADLVCLILN